MSKEKYTLAASLEQGKHEVQHRESKYKSPKLINLKEIFQASIPAALGDEVLVPSPRQQTLGVHPSSGDSQQLRKSRAQHLILAGLGSLQHSHGAFCTSVQQYWPYWPCGAGYMSQAALAGLWQDCSSKGTWARRLPDPSHPSFGFATLFWCQEEIIQPKYAHQRAVYLSEMFGAKAGSWPW